MSAQKDLLIVGAGAIGLSLADVCLRAGLSVLVLDKSGVAQEASWAGAGMLTCRPRLKRDASKPDYYDLALRSVRLHAEWAARLKEETGVDTGYRVCGALELSRAHPAPTAMPSDLAEEETSGGGDKSTISKDSTAEWIALCSARGVPARWIDAAEARRLEPQLSPDVLGAIEFSNEAQVRNPWFTRALETSVRKRGGEIRTGTLVADFIFDEATQSVLGVKTTSGDELRAGRVAICSGAWAGQFDFVTQRVPALKKVVPVRGQLVCYETQPILASHLICERNHYFVPRDDGVLLVGATHEKAGFDKSVTAEGTAELERFAHSILPALSSLKPVKTWAGLRPGMKGRHPLIGPIPGAKNLFISAGHYRNGLTLAPASAELLAGIMLNQSTPVAPEPWLP
jgi:glycine oxidase